MSLPPLLLLLALGGCLGVASGARGSDTNPGGCGEVVLAMYRAEVRTAWSRQVFPKQYPEWRPPAQWSKVLGRSHDPSYKIFRLNEAATEGLKQFAELGQTEQLDKETQGAGGVLDQFTAPPVPQGVGDTHTQFFVDGNHSKVSLVSRIVPSPDWFIGVDSFDLCVEGKWIESVVLEVDPLDAGTDNGFTFTSPNWPTIPRRPISRITAQRPDHPANSFYYPDVEAHPPIATFHLAKVKEYDLTRVFTPPRSSSVRYTSSDLSARNPSRRRQRTETEETESETQLENEEPGESSNAINRHRGNTIGGSGGMRSRDNVDTHHDLGAGRKPTLINTIVNKYKKKYRKNRRGRKMAAGRQSGARRRLGRRRLRAPRDCRVTEWAEWSPCSKTCGIGEQMRTRTVLRPSRRGGKPCPDLQETTWCGSSRDCEHKYFDW